MSSRTRIGTLLCVTLAALAGAANGQAIFRCGDSYSQAPCANAKVVALESPATAAQRAEARAVAAREKRLAHEMVRDRRERERALRPAGATSLGPTPPPRAASAPAGKKQRAKKRATGDEGEHDFVAAVPRSRK
jgi:hypothetical protein